MVDINLMISPLLSWFCVLITTSFIILEPILLKSLQKSVSFRPLRLSESDDGQALQDKGLAVTGGPLSLRRCRWKK
jgi:hypothetical protein